MDVVVLWLRSWHTTSSSAILYFPGWESSLSTTPPPDITGPSAAPQTPDDGGPSGAAPTVEEAKQLSTTPAADPAYP
ncbi:UNVERIFIED_CONTAM: hypothetical protein Sradi_3340000 [Sesamum radiatum]|uniref:Uncharacterized protein n=1 Tax=Sesamum radiatum TaxID=300843 RepID=A0AAW2R353_SESRA